MSESPTPRTPIPEFPSDELAAAPALFVQRRAARFQEIDAAGIVFFARLFDWFHDAYFAFLEGEGGRLPEVMVARPWIAPLRRVDAEFLRPIRFGDEVEVAIVALRLDGSELRTGYRIAPAGGGKPLALGRITAVFVDGQSFKRIEPPEFIRAAAARLARAT